MAPIDVDNPETWPPQIHYMTSTWAKQCAGRTRYTNDLPLALELEVPFRQELAGHLVRAYHYTKLLPHEKQMIQQQGLRMLSASLLEERIEAGVRAGVISHEEASCFRASHVFAAGEELPVWSGVPARPAARIPGFITLIPGNHPFSEVRECELSSQTTEHGFPNGLLKLSALSVLLSALDPFSGFLCSIRFVNMTGVVFERCLDVPMPENLADCEVIFRILLKPTSGKSVAK